MTPFEWETIEGHTKRPSERQASRGCLAALLHALRAGTWSRGGHTEKGGKGRGGCKRTCLARRVYPRTLPSWKALRGRTEARRQCPEWR